MPAILTFIIPVPHPDNGKNWAVLKKNLAETIRSISQQKNDLWNAVIVANHGSDLPDISTPFEIKWVDFPPNPLDDKDAVDKETFYHALRLDKGRRVLAGMLHANAQGHIMVVDDDDFVSSRLTTFVAQNPHQNGWYFKTGYIWSEGTPLLYKYSDFSKFCGTSHIIRADLYKIAASVEATPEVYIRRMLGAHIFIREEMEAAGAPLAELPLIGAVYRVGHAIAHSKSRRIFPYFFLRKEMMKRPRELCRRLLRLRLITPAIRKEFFGAS